MNKATKYLRFFVFGGILSALLIITVNYESVWVTYETQKNIILMQEYHRSLPKEDETCRDIFEVRKVHPNMSERTNLAVSVVSKAKEERAYLRSLYYEVISYESPSMVRKEQEQKDGVTTGTNFTIKKEWRLHQVNGQLAHLPCRLREYSPKDVQECAFKRTSAGKGKTHLLYIGDSRIRQHVEVITELLKPLNPKITTYKGDILTVEEFIGDKGMKDWRKYKHNFKVESPDVPDFLIEFNWAALIDWGDVPKHFHDHFSYKKKPISVSWGNLNPEISVNDSMSGHGKRPNSTEAAAINKQKTAEMMKSRIGALDKLEQLLLIPKEELPSIILLNTGAWLLAEDYATQLKAIDHSSILVMNALMPLLTKLSKLTTVVWIAPDPFKEYVYHRLDGGAAYTAVTEANLEWLLNAQALLLPPEVIFWDSFLPISYASKDDCITFLSQKIDMKMLPKFLDFDPQITWNCLERLHIGLEALSIAVQMALNQVCNPYISKGFCCTDIPV